MDSESKKAYYYVFAEKYTQQEVDKMLEQQRQMCADAIAEKVKPITLHPDVINACLDATG